MRTEFLTDSVNRNYHSNSNVADTEAEVYDHCPWAAKVERVTGGWYAWESVTDWDIWKAQK